VQWIIDGRNDGNAILTSRFSDTGLPIDAINPDQPTVPDGLSFLLGRLEDTGINFATLIRALAGNSESNLLSTPSLVTLDNEEAEIIVGQNIPIITGESSSGTGPLEISNPFRTIEREDIGVSLKVKPQINEGNTITMKIEQEVSSINPASLIASDIITNKRLIKATVQLEDGELLVLGGLIDDKVVESVSKVPGLGDIPGIGALFRSTKKENKKQNLLVFLRATIIKDPDLARSLSHRKYNWMRDSQLQNMKENDAKDRAILKPIESLDM
jgi:general secretion pathway protein D